LVRCAVPRRSGSTWSSPPPPPISKTVAPASPCAVARSPMRGAAGVRRPRRW
jgi:hypothetical protein